MNLAQQVITEELLLKYSNKNTKTEAFHTKIVGTTFRNQEDLDKIQNGDYVLLDPEVGNPHDPFAVRVLHNNTGNHIGYIKRELNKDIWENTVKLGHLYIAKVEITGGTEDKKTKGYNLTVKHVWLDDTTQSA